MVKYKPINRIIVHPKKTGFVNFIKEETYEIVRNLAQKIEDHGKYHNLTVDFSPTKQGPYEARFNTRDGIITGSIISHPSYFFCMNPSEIHVNLQFNSDKEEDKDEYKGLAKLVKNYELPRIYHKA